MTVNEYCTKIKSVVDRLKNLGGVVSDKNLVIYTINGLDSRFATLVEIIRNRETFPTFEATRTMLLLKESPFHDDSEDSTTFESSSSSPTVLMASNSSNATGTLNKSSSLPQLCNHFNKGTCRFGDLHDHRNRVGLASPKNNNNQNRGRPTVSNSSNAWGNNTRQTSTRQAQYRNPTAHYHNQSAYIATQPTVIPYPT
ncbi:hypothetical protein Tco_0723338 [Tanacetum coccineum]